MCSEYYGSYTRVVLRMRGEWRYGNGVGVEGGGGVGGREGG
jgi:hypothetical protein